MLGRPADRLLLLTLVFILGVSLGALYDPLRLFLNQQVENTLGFFAGHPLERETSAFEKLQNDLGLAPTRSMRDAAGDLDFDFQAVTAAAGLDQLLPESRLELYLERDMTVLDDFAGMLIKTQADSGRGYSPQLLLVGFDGVLHKRIPFGLEGECDCSAREPLNYFHIDGNPADVQTRGNSLVNLNSCGHIDWSQQSRYSFHHYLNNDGDHRQPAFWVLDATDLLQIETASGRELERISLGDIINANPDLPVFEARLKGTRPQRWQYGAADFSPQGRTHSSVTNADPDPFHTNDIDEYLGDETGLFKRGDLLLSFRSLNLLLVVRPATRKIVWYAYGLTSRQHDPDFTSANSILVYDNNFHNSSSQILRLEAGSTAGSPASFAVERQQLVADIAGLPFHQLIEGYQFFIDRDRHLVVSANDYNAGIDTRNGQVFMALRHRWREQTFLAVDIERFLGREAFDDIKNARCL